MNTKGKRFLASSGIFKGIFKEEFTDEELINIDEEKPEGIKPEDIRAYSFENKYRKYLRDFYLEEIEREKLEYEKELTSSF